AHQLGIETRVRFTRLLPIEDVGALHPDVRDRHRGQKTAHGMKDDGELVPAILGLGCRHEVRALSRYLRRTESFPSFVSATRSIWTGSSYETTSRLADWPA